MKPLRPAEGTLTDARPEVVELPGVRLVLTPGRGKKVAVPLGVDPIIIGSDPDCDVVVDLSLIHI